MNNLQSLLLFRKPLCLKRHHITWSQHPFNQPTLDCDSKNNEFNTGLGEVTTSQDRFRCMCGGKGRGGWSGSLNGRGMTMDQAVVQRCCPVGCSLSETQHIAYDRCFSWKCITRLSFNSSRFSWVSKRIPNWNSPRFNNFQLQFLPVSCIWILHILATFRDTCCLSSLLCIHPNTYTWDCFPLSINILIKSPQL